MPAAEVARTAAGALAAAAPEINDPVTYSWWWDLVAAAAVLIVVAWIVFVLVSTRRRPPDEDDPLLLMAMTGDRFAAVRPVYLKKIDAVEERYRDGELDVRALHLELSAVVREFATIRRGVDASVLTLSDLRRLEGTRHLAGLIETYYRPAFSRDGAPHVQPEASIHGARTVVSQW